jgi:hypothetical protein
MLISQIRMGTHGEPGLVMRLSGGQSGISWKVWIKGIIGYIHHPPSILKAKWKVRVLLHPGAAVEVQALAAPADAGESHFLDSTGLKNRTIPTLYTRGEGQDTPPTPRSRDDRYLNRDGRRDRCKDVQNDK